MKNLFIGLLMLAGTATFANSNVSTKTQTSTNVLKTVVVVSNEVLTSCSASTGGVTITVTCGCTDATCRKVLIKILSEL